MRRGRDAGGAQRCRAAPEAQQATASATRTIAVFMCETLPAASEATRTLAGGLVKTAISEVGKQFSESPRTTQEVEVRADEMADMFCAYLERLRGDGC
jgi:hypothetical protein